MNRSPVPLRPAVPRTDQNRVPCRLCLERSDPRAAGGILRDGSNNRRLRGARTAWGIQGTCHAEAVRADPSRQRRSLRSTRCRRHPERRRAAGKEKDKFMADDKERGKAIEAALAQIDKQFGKGSIMRLGSREKVDVPAIPTGSLSLDAALGVGGVPRGRVIEIFGPESSGKTTLSLHVIAEAQRRGGMP